MRIGQIDNSRQRPVLWWLELVLRVRLFENGLADVGDGRFVFLWFARCYCIRACTAACPSTGKRWIQNPIGSILGIGLIHPWIGYISVIIIIIITDVVVVVMLSMEPSSINQQRASWKESISRFPQYSNRTDQKIWSMQLVSIWNALNGQFYRMWPMC